MGTRTTSTSKWNTFAEGLIDIGGYMVKDSFEQRAWDRKKKIEQELWEQQNAITNKQNQDSADLLHQRNKETAAIKQGYGLINKGVDQGYKRETAATKFETDTSLQELRNEGSMDTAKEATRREEVKRTAKLAEETATPVEIRTRLSETEAQIKKLNAGIAAYQLENYGERPEGIDKTLNIYRKELIVLKRIDELFKAGKTEAANKALGDYMQEYHYRLQRMRKAQEAEAAKKASK